MKTKLLWMIKSIKLIIILFGSMAFAQTTQVSGTIDPVQEDGLYRIRIPHNLRTYATHNLRDIRIWDAKGHQVPYFVQPVTDYKTTKVSDFTEFPILSSSKIADTSSTYIFKNPYKTLENAVLLIANYQGSKSYSLEGSKDQEQWFGLVNNEQISVLKSSKEPHVYKNIYFPLSTYPYLKIVFNDRHSLPINLLKIGMANTETVNLVPISMEKVPVKSIDFLEKDKKTQIHIHFERQEVIDQIRLDITAPELFSRNALVYTMKEREVKRSMETYRQNLESFTIRSDQELVFHVPGLLEKELYLEIDNKDNPKLQINSIQLMQEPVYLVAALKGREAYKVTAGTDTLDFPDYDISKVTNTIKTELPIAEIRSVVYEQPIVAAKKSDSFWQQAWFMWVCIALAGLMISYYAFNLLKDLDKNKTD